jgi:hypothetical protein
MALFKHALGIVWFASDGEADAAKSPNSRRSTIFRPAAHSSTGTPHMEA